MNTGVDSSFSESVVLFRVLLSTAAVYRNLEPTGHPAIAVMLTNTLKRTYRAGRGREWARNIF